MASLIVDIHPHIVSRDTRKYPISPLAGQRSEWSEDHAVDAEEMVAAMADAGVDKMAMVHSSTTYGFNCDYVADMAEKYPDKFTGVFSVDIVAPDGPQKMRHWVARGCTGLRVYTRGKTIKQALVALDDPRTFGVYETAGALGISVSVNPRVANFNELESILQKFPGVSFILENLGKSDFTGGAPFNEAKPLFDLSRHPNLYLKIKTENNLQATEGKATPETMFAKLVSVFGADRMAWGSNYPASDGTLKELTELARRSYASLPQADQDWILGKTALKLYPALAR
jgi:predicted TIM-barrel fold metal-dependent hydrolase